MNIYEEIRSKLTEEWKGGSNTTGNRRPSRRHKSAYQQFDIREEKRGINETGKFFQVVSAS